MNSTDFAGMDTELLDAFLHQRLVAIEHFHENDSFGLSRRRSNVDEIIRLGPFITKWTLDVGPDTARSQIILW